MYTAKLTKNPMATGLSIYLPQGICRGLRRWYIIRLSKYIFFDEKVFLALRQKDFLDYTDTVSPPNPPDYKANRAFRFTIRSTKLHLTTKSPISCR